MEHGTIEGVIADDSDALPRPEFDYDYSLSFPKILHKLGISLAVTTYQAGCLCIISSNGIDVSANVRNYRKAMGCYPHSQGLLLATENQVLSFKRSQHLIKSYYPLESYDELYVPRIAYFTGNIASHDVLLTNEQALVVSSAYSCIGGLSSNHSFVPLWKPHFITELTGEDRCHLNGLALEDGRIRYVTALGATNSRGGWRENRATGGIVMDVEHNCIICEGLSMRHSPRVYENLLWVLSSGTGELGIVNSLGFEPMIYLPGFLRGLAFFGPYAFVGLSKIREKSTFGGLQIEEKVQDLKCSVEVVNIHTGTWEASLEFHSNIAELYDIQVITHARNPFITGYSQKGDLQQLVDLPLFNPLVQQVNG